jgi:hypothetical protein
MTTPEHSDQKPSHRQLNLVSILLSKNTRRRITEADVHCRACADRWIQRTKRRPRHP